MTLTLITPAEVIARAFTPGELVSPDDITREDILAAESRWIDPVIGEELHNALIASMYPDFMEHYLLQPLALYTRLLVQDRLNVKTSSAGTSAPERAASDKALHRMKAALGREAAVLLRRMSDHLNRTRGEYPEYDPAKNPLNRCSIHGNIVQTF